MVVPEGIFVQVALQVLGGYRVVDAVYAALGERPEPLYGVRVDRATNVDLFGVMYAVMLVARTIQAIV